MLTYKEIKKLKMHAPFIKGNNLTYFVPAQFPTDELRKILPKSMSIPRDEVMALGEKNPQSPWKIGLQAPRATMGNLLTTLPVSNQALATSGDYLQAFSPDFANHHIIDPRSGHSSPELASVMVLAPTVMLADGLATAVIVMGKSGWIWLNR